MFSGMTEKPVISQFMRDKASRTRLAIESFYAQTVTQTVERDSRAKKLEEKMAAEGIRFLNFSAWFQSW